MTSIYRRFLPIARTLASAAFLVAALFFAPPALADEPAPLATALSVQPLAPVTIGTGVTVVAQLTSATGAIPGAVDNEALEFFIDGERERRVRTNFAGVASFPVRRFLPVGQHTLTVVYAGSQSLQPASATATLTVVPAVLEIATVPAMEGVPFSLAGQQVTSGEDGIARFTIDTPGTYRLEVLPVERDDIRAEFGRWGDEVFVAAREVEIPKTQALEVGFDVSYRASFSFVDLAGLSVDPNRVTSMTIRSTLGETRTLTGTGPEWFQAGRVIRRINGLEETPVQWSIEEVVIGGTNVVNRSQQRFFLEPDTHVQVEVLLYTARFTARDALFGFSLGRGVRLEYPDGTVTVVPFGADRTVFLTSLPRGEYRVSVDGAPGFSPTSPLALSRDQDAELVVVSYLDFMVVGLLASSLAFGLLAVGRPYLLARIRQRAAPHREQTAVLAAVGASLILGVIVFTLGSGRAPAGDAEHPPSAATSDVEAAPRSTDAPLRVLTTLPGSVGFVQDVHDLVDLDRMRAALDALTSLVETGTPPNTTTSPRVPQASPTPLPVAATPPIADVFQAFWKRNGGLATFGPPLADAVYWRDPGTGQILLVQEFASARLEYHPQHRGTPYEIQLGRVGLEDAQRRGLVALDAFRPLDPTTARTEDCTYFQATRHRICGHFRAYWRNHGLEFGDPGVSLRESLARFGYPISEEFVDPETGMRVQYFERARLEYHPEHAGKPYEVLPGQLERDRP